jgi:AcrR family transcriptional regulator
VSASASITPAEPGAPGGCPRPLRADATRNRDAILAAAREIFAEHGLQAPLEEIARRAGVGIATLYRRFPAREQLVAAALAEKVSQYAGAAEQALAMGDPWEGFASYVRTICQLQADDRGLSDLLSITLAADEHVELLRARANEHVVELVERAQAAGRLRADFACEDLRLLLIANAAVVRFTRADAPDAWRRFAELILDAFQRADGARLPAPPSRAQMDAAMLRLARVHGCASAPR